MWKFTAFLFVAFLVVIFGSPTPQFAADKPGYCRLGDIYIKEGETGYGPIGTCSGLQCINAATGGHGDLLCGAIISSQGCRDSGYDLTKQYPDCCPRRICDEE